MNCEVTNGILINNNAKQEAEFLSCHGSFCCSVMLQCVPMLQGKSWGGGHFLVPTWVIQ